MARKRAGDDVQVSLTAGGKTATTTLGGLEAKVASLTKPKRNPRESTFEVILAGVPWNAGGTAHAVKLELEHHGGRPDPLLMFLTQVGRGSIDLTLRVNRVELQTSWRGIALIDQATWKPAGGEKGHPAVVLKMSVTEDANNGPETLRSLVRFRLSLGEEDVQVVEMSALPYDGPLFPAETGEVAP